MMQRGVPSGFGGTIARWRHRFFVNVDALKRIKPDMPFDELDFSIYFDSNRKLIHATSSLGVSAVVWGSYDLVAADF